MFVLDYVKNLGSKVFSRKSIEDNISITRDELTNHVIPAVKRFAKTFPGKPRLKGDIYPLYEKAISAGLGNHGDPITAIEMSLINAERILDFTGKYVENKLQGDVSASGLTIADANILQLVDAIAFVNRYTMRLIDTLLVAASNYDMGKEGQELDGVRQADIDMLARDREGYIATLRMLQTPSDKFETIFDNIPEIVITDVKSKAALSIQGNDKVDPLGFGRNFVDSYANPIWIGAVIIAEYQDTRYRSMKKDAELIQVRIARLEAQYRGKPDPGKAKIIENYEGMAHVLRAKLAKYMEKAK